MTGKILSMEDMAALSASIRAEGKTCVFTNGCFDIVHAGHVTYLHEARRLGNTLFIGLNSDSSARALKGPDRPFNPEFDRATVLAALEDVSAVAIFDEPTAVNLVRMVRPNIYVKGGDYSQDPASPAFPVEGEAVTRYGGQVRIIPFSPGYSTTTLVERIRRLAE